MAAAFALLLLLPTHGQGTFDRTDGRISGGGLSVGVFANIQDAQLEKNERRPYTDGTIIYLPVEEPQTYLGTQGFLNEDDTAYLANPLASPQHTFFGETLWVSNDPEAYNTILITAEKDRVMPRPTEGGCAVASVRSPSSNSSITVQMAETTETDGTTYYQAFVRVLDSRVLDEQGDRLYKSSHGPDCARDDTDPLNIPPNYEDRDVNLDATASILARHGDRITISVAGAGEVTLDVDGEGPGLVDIAPEDMSFLRSRDLDFSFIVRDEDAGLRHDGELVITEDGDYTEVNRDGDHVTSGEPLSMPSAGQISVNGEAAEIDLKVWAMHTNVNGTDDITETGNWTLVGNRPGVAYAFSADTNDYAEGAYFMEVSAKDRVGNKAVSAAPDDENPGPHHFTVDDTDPEHIEAWTGIAYEMNYLGGYEIPDRSWIMVEFTEPLRTGIDPEKIRVAGHEVVSVYQPDYAPPFERTVMGRNGLSQSAQRLTFAPPTPRAGVQSAPMAQTCTTLPAGTRITGLSFEYDETTGDTAGDVTISWNRLSDYDCNGYRLALLSGRTVLIVEDLPRTTSSYNIPRASELGRYIEAEIEDTDVDTLTIVVGLRYASVGAFTDDFGDGEASRTIDLDDGLTPPASDLTGSATKPFILHPSSPPASLPAIPAGNASIECGFTGSGGDEVVFSFTHTPATVRGWTLVGYYRQLFYPPDYNVDLASGRLFDYTAVGADGYETSGSFQNFYDTEIQLYNAEGQVVAVYEKDSRRLAGAVRTLRCTGSTVTNPTVDNIAPRLLAARVNDTTVWLGYNEPLNGNSEPDPDAYEISGEERTVTDVDVSGSTVRLMLSTPVAEGEDVTLTYTPPQATPVQDRAGNDAFMFRLWPVTNAKRLSHAQSLMQLGYWPEDINGELIDDTRTRIYIEVARELEADEKPEVTLFGGVILDLADNPNATEAITPRDGIAPRFTVTVTATAQDRPVANDRGEYVVEVRADEDLRRRPVVYFADIEAKERLENGKGTGEYDYSPGDDLETGGSLIAQEDENHWAKTYPAADLSGIEGLFGLVVYGFDQEDNIGESGGWTRPRHQRTPEIGHPRPDHDLNLTEMHEAGVLLERDREFNGGEEAVHAVKPGRRMRDDETESPNPFVSISFPMEADEYAACPNGRPGCGDPNPDAEFSDSHAQVDITAITLNDENAMSMLNRVDAGQFALVATGLELGSYEIEYTAVDEAGNEMDGEFTFSVLERSPYELAVIPGWNLISFPGTPEEPSLGGVIPSGARVSPVLAYQDGDWLTAVANEEGEWGGNLTEFEGGFGYWLFAEAYATLAPVIADPDLTTTPPTVAVQHGWNLLGVIDLFQNPAGAPPGGTVGSDAGALGDGNSEADDYFGSIPWRVAYGYDTFASLWVKVVPGADRKAPEGTTEDESGYRLVDGEVVAQEILNGKGYWVWSSEPGTLVP